MDDDIDLARETIRHAFWEVRYHEIALEKAHHKVGLVKALLTRAQLPFDPAKALAFYKDDEDGEDLSTSEDLAIHLLGDALQNIEYHEEALANGHHQVSGAKALILRAGLQGEISFAEAEAHAKKRLEE
jgi:hypothetical protein